ncbi:MAG: CDP-alcohol phosphatidyltransferase family protein [Candidatus Nanopelagicales bacterium]|nr:CDP-alcohol phosphatidyltransferase family protein [Candidatus Nanopelagicales bacterium]
MSSERVITVPNALSVVRLIGVPIFLWLILVPQADGWAFLVLAVAGVTDWLDGALARMLNQQSRLGALLDPAADRLYIAATIVGLALRSIIPWWIVAALVARDVLLLGLIPLLRKHGMLTLPVTMLGKAATFCLLWGFPMLLLSTFDTWWGSLAGAAGWAFSLWGVALYWWAGLDYIRTARALSRSDTKHDMA